MIDKTKIKVVKRTDAVAAKSKKKNVVTTRASAREMVSTVTEWVSDLKQRKGEETKAAFDLLFAASRQANES
jgi:sorbitol-specific phosphotransferase system component IIBC